ncbi:hypothetical protein BKA64DRAFT_713926 [Cadophora sp. MPI-SDFR-AT-0126]|nr:hypothetical protein BKA64DRAFT_713926 [Leotiomycetes sp. MPI-SDFR-AT-0126]
MLQTDFLQAIICWELRDVAFPVPESKKASLEIPKQSVKAPEMYKSPQRLNDFEPVELSSSELRIENLLVTDESLEDPDDFAVEAQVLSMAKDLDGIRSTNDILSHGVYVSAVTSEEQDEYLVADQQMQFEFQETPGELDSILLAPIKSGMDQWPLQFMVFFRTYFSGRAAKQGQISAVNRVVRAVQAVVFLPKRNIKKAQLVKKRRDEQEEKKKQRDIKKDYKEAEGKWLCHVCDDDPLRDAFPEDDRIPFCPQCDHPHRDCVPCHDLHRIVRYFHLKREERERNERNARAAN